MIFREVVNDIALALNRTYLIARYKKIGSIELKQKWKIHKKIKKEAKIKLKSVKLWGKVTETKFFLIPAQDYLYIEIHYYFDMTPFCNNCGLMNEFFYMACSDSDCVIPEHEHLKICSSCNLPIE